MAKLFGSWPNRLDIPCARTLAGWLEHLRASLAVGTISWQLATICWTGRSTDEAAWRFLTSDSHGCWNAGWQVLLPAWWEAASRKKPRLRAKVRAKRQEPAVQAARCSGSTRSSTSTGVSPLATPILREAEFAELVARNERLVRFRGQWIQLDPALLAQIRKAMASVGQRQGLSFQDVLQLHLLGGRTDEPTDDDSPEQRRRMTSAHQLEVELNEHLIKLIGQLGQQTEWPTLAVPAGLQAELRAYQHDGFRLACLSCAASDLAPV